jgi:hypothetical protein
VAYIKKDKQSDPRDVKSLGACIGSVLLIGLFLSDGVSSWWECAGMYLAFPALGFLTLVWNIYVER